MIQNGIASGSGVRGLEEDEHRKKSKSGDDDNERYERDKKQTTLNNDRMQNAYQHIKHSYITIFRKTCFFGHTQKNSLKFMILKHF